MTRGGAIESCHLGVAVVVEPGGREIARAGDPAWPVVTRSSVKPFQALPLVVAGGLEAFGLDAADLALVCSSHSGTEEQAARAEAMLARAGLDRSALACGAHRPYDESTAAALDAAGRSPSALHNNCSGKHAAMLARAHVSGWSSHGYEREGHQVQAAALESVSRWTGVPADRIERAVDGCGVVVFGLPLAHMARAYAMLAASATRGDELASRIARAVRTRPFLFGGTDRFDSVLVEETSGRIISKVGAEGIHSAALLEQGIGMVVKVEDGASRAQYPALLRLLQLHGALPDPLPPRLQEFGRTRIRNTRGEVVGELRVIDA